MPDVISTSMQGVDVTVKVAGNGPPLLFLHGGAGSDWNPGLERLSEHFKVYVPEHPGFGVTERPEWLETTQDLAVWNMDLIDHLQIGPVHLAGHSMGGWIAAELASLCAHQLRKLVLIAAAGLRIPGEQRLDLFLITPEEAAPAVFHDPALAQRAFAPPATPEAQRAAVRNRNMTARLGWNPYLCNPALEWRLRRIDIPTLVVWGKHDGLIPVSHARLYGERIPDARVAVLDDCGHVPFVERTEEFTRLVTDFLAE